MSKTNWGDLTEQILAALKEYGPMTRAEIEQHIGAKPYAIGGHISRMTRSYKTVPQRLHISGYTRDAEGARSYLRPIYSLGPGDNKPRPPGYDNKARAAYYKMQEDRIRNSFVFNLGLRRDDIRQMKKDVLPTEVHMGQRS